MNEATDIARWIVQSLQGAGAPTYNTTAPASAPDTYILFSRQGGFDAPSFGAGPRVAAFTYLIRATGRTNDTTALEGLASNIDILLEKAVAPATSTDLGLNILGVLREQPFEMVEVVDGVVYRHLGGIYTIRAQEA